MQFRAHKSPISALAFDPTGILLVTASVHGHNINVFRVMPSVSGSKSRSDACGSYTHLYRLQRGFTNAVIFSGIYVFSISLDIVPRSYHYGGMSSCSYSFLFMVGYSRHQLQR